MYSFAEIEKMLEKGFTPEQITQLQSQPDTQTKTETETQTKTKTETETQTQTKTAPDWAQTLTDSIAALRRSIQAQALAGAQQSAPADTDELAHQALASIIAPTFKKEEK